MTTARDIMTADVQCASVDDTLVDAARKMRDLGVGALPICGDDDKLKGMLTDRDITVRVVAEGKDPGSVKVSELADGKPVTIGADDDLKDALRTMQQHDVRRLPVIDGHRLVGMISQGDISQNLAGTQTGTLVEDISAAPPNN